MTSYEDNYFDEFKLLGIGKIKIIDIKEIDIKNDDERSIFINMTTSIEEIINFKLDDKDLIKMNSLYICGINRQYSEWTICYDIKNDKIIVDGNAISIEENSNVIKEMRFIYSNKFREGYKPGGECPDLYIKAMSPNIYNGKTKLNFPIYVQPKYNGYKIMFCQNSPIGNKITLKEHRDELLNFMSYIPHNCILDIIIYSNGNSSKNISKSIDDGNFNNISYIICDFYCYIYQDFGERFEILEKAYKNYLLDYEIEDPKKCRSRINISKKSSIRLTSSYITNNIEEIELYKNEILNKGYSNVIIKKISHMSKKLDYKSGKNSRILIYK